MEKVAAFENVFLDENSDRKLDDIVEKDFFIHMLADLKLKMRQAFDKFDFYIFLQYKFDSNVLPASADGKDKSKKILIFLCEEHSSIPTPLSANYLAIFKSYLPHDRKLGNIYPLPLGCPPRPGTQEVLDINRRPYNVFFSGRLTHIRKMGLYKECAFLRKVHPGILVRLPQRMINWIGNDFSGRFPDSYIKFTSGYGQGLDYKTYSQYLENSKIALCPRGLISSETQRLYEAMRAGCIIITEKLPDTHLYRKSPIIQIDDNWAAGLKMVKNLLADPQQLQELQQSTIRWWKRNCSESGAARFVLVKLKQQITSPDAILTDLKI